MLYVPQSEIEDNVMVALREDIGTGDITAELIPEDEIVLASVITREACVFCGMDWFEEVFRQVNDEVFIEWNIEDGEHIEANATLCSISGSARSILTGERTALNFIQLLSATATLSSRYAQAVEGTGAIVLDTRKTIPGLRLAQKYAVSCGGCQNHRIGLYDAILIKENHIAAHGSIAGAVEEAKFLYPDTMVEVEVENIDEFSQALATPAPGGYCWIIFHSMTCAKRCQSIIKNLTMKKSNWKPRVASRWKISTALHKPALTIFPPAPSPRMLRQSIFPCVSCNECRQNSLSRCISCAADICRRPAHAVVSTRHYAKKRIFQQDHPLVAPTQ